MMPVSPLSKRIGTETSMQFTIMGYERELKWERSASGQEIGSDRKRGIKKVSFTPKHGVYRRERKRQASMISLREEGESGRKWKEKKFLQKRFIRLGFTFLLPMLQ